MKKIFEIPLFYAQILMVYFFSFIFILISKKEKNSIVIGADEIAWYINHLGKAIKSSTTVNFSGKNRFVNELTYDYKIGFNNRFINYFVRIIYGPLVFAKLALKNDIFIYIWSSGFLLNSIDAREFEFNFLKKTGSKIVCIFMGSEIRSDKLMNLTYPDFDTISSFNKFNKCKYDEKKTESSIEKTVLVTEKYADLIFNSKADQVSYFKREVKDFFYLWPDDDFKSNHFKFSNLDRIKIVHAPSNPIIKGTQIVRATIRKLQIEGYNIDYVELIEKPHRVILHELSSSHIVINELYSFTLGVFGIEAMANNCALLTSADPFYEQSLNLPPRNAWITTKYWELYDKLKYLLDNKEDIIDYAKNGQEWVKNNCSYKKINSLLKEYFIEAKILNN